MLSVKNKSKMRVQESEKDDLYSDCMSVDRKKHSKLTGNFNSKKRGPKIDVINVASLDNDQTT